MTKIWVTLASNTFSATVWVGDIGQVLKIPKTLISHLNKSSNGKVSEVLNITTITAAEANKCCSSILLFLGGQWHVPGSRATGRHSKWLGHLAGIFLRSCCLREVGIRPKIHCIKSVPFHYWLVGLPWEFVLLGIMQGYLALSRTFRLLALELRAIVSTRIHVWNALESGALEILWVKLVLNFLRMGDSGWITKSFEHLSRAVGFLPLYREKLTRHFKMCGELVKQPVNVLI